MFPGQTIPCPAAKLRCKHLDVRFLHYGRKFGAGDPCHGAEKKEQENMGCCFFIIFEVGPLAN